MELLQQIEDAAANQKVRLFDIYALGPFLIWYAVKSKGMGSWSRRALFTAGVYTLIYNLKAYRNIKADLEAQAAAAGITLPEGL